jgi:hypothetical protein
MPEQHRKDSRHAEHQRKGDEIPLLAEKIYVRILKKFHSRKTPRRSSLVVPSFSFAKSLDP